MEKMIFYTNALPIYRHELYVRLQRKGWRFIVGNLHQFSDVLFGLNGIDYRMCKVLKIGAIKFSRFPVQKNAKKVLLNFDRSDVGFWLLLARYSYFHCNTDVVVWGHITYEKDSALTRYILRKVFSKVKLVFSYGSFPIISLGLKNIVQVYNGVAWDRPAFRPALVLRSKLVYVGRRSVVKKLDVLIDYCDILGICVDIVSPDIIESDSKYVNYVGYLSGNELRAFLLDGNYLAMVSLGNAGLNSIEASMCSLPTISQWNLETNMPEIEHLSDLDELFMKDSSIGQFKKCYDYLTGLNVESYRAIQSIVFNGVEKWTVKHQWSIFNKYLHEAT